MTEDGPSHTYAEHVVAPLLRPVLKPAVQSKHASARAAGAYVPAGHDSQLCSFLTYVPAGQSRLLGSGIRMTENSVDGLKGGFGGILALIDSPPHEDRSAELSLP